MKYIYKINKKIAVVIMSMVFLLLFFTYYANINNSISVVDEKEKISMLQYTEIKETYDKIKGISTKKTHVIYLYPGKLRIENEGLPKTVEIYNGKRYIYYDIVSRIAKHKIILSNKIPSAMEKSLMLDKIIKSGEYEFFGYEEKENKQLMVIGEVIESDGKILLNKYWIEKIYNTNLLYKEECFVDNTVVSKTTYIYSKINEEVNKDIFIIP